MTTKPQSRSAVTMSKVPGSFVRSVFTNYTRCQVLYRVTWALISANTFGVFLLHQYFVDYFNLTEMINSVIGGFVLWAVIYVGCFILSVLIGQTPIIKEALKY